MEVAVGDAPRGARGGRRAHAALVACMAAALAGCSPTDDDPGPPDPPASATDRDVKAPRNSLRFDWNADAREDLAWQHRDTKALTVWRMAGTTVLGTAAAGRTADALFSLRARLVGTDPCFDQVEYDGATLTLVDRYQDIASNTCVPAGHPGAPRVVQHAPPGWSLVAAEGSYDGSRQNQLLWRSATGTVGIWKLGPDGSIAASGFPATASPQWTIVDARGDYDGDGRTDVLWRNAEGTVAIWRMTALDAVADTVFFGTAPIGRWRLADGAGDYDGNGRSDLLWVDVDGNVVIWFLDMAARSFRAVSLGSAGPGWRVLDASSDLNGDARSDIVWQDLSGAVAVWLVNERGIIGARPIGTIDPAWELVSRSMR
jgi:hypothetical protein